MSKGVLTFCVNTQYYRYDKIAQKTLPLFVKNLGIPVTVVTNKETYKLIGNIKGIDYRVIDNQIGNFIDGKPWHNLDRYRAYELSPYDRTLLVDLDYFCYTDFLLSLFDTDYDLLVHDKVHDVSGRGTYDFRAQSSIPMVWATLIFFRKTPKAKAVFDMVEYIKNHYDYFCNLYRISFRNFRNDYAFAIALHQLNGFLKFPLLDTKLATLPATCRVTSFDDKGITWQTAEKIGRIEMTDVHVIDKGVANV